MAAQGFDTHDAYETLVENNCFNELQANRIVSIVKQAVTGEVATKVDLAELKGELKADIAKLDVKIGEVRTEIGDLRTELKTEIGDLRTELKTEIAGLRSELKTEIAGLRSELKTEIAGLRSELKTEIATVRTDLAKQHTRMIVWVVGAIAAVATAVKAMDFLL